MEYDIVTGDDADNGAGVYAMFEFDVSPNAAIQIEASYVGGSYSTDAGSDDYRLAGIGAALILSRTYDTWSPYIGAGAADNFNDFGKVDYGDHLSIFWLAGSRLFLNDATSVDLSIRYRGLKPASVDPTIGEIDLNAFVLRAGVVFEL